MMLDSFSHEECRAKLAAAEAERDRAYEEMHRKCVLLVGDREKAEGHSRVLDDMLAGAQAETRAQRDRADRAERERDLAVAHDRQPYPTAAAYEAVCAARTKWQGKYERLTEALGFGDAWPICDVLNALADAGDHLRETHSCDAHGYELVGAAVERAREIREAVFKALEEKR